MRKFITRTLIVLLILVTIVALIIGGFYLYFYLKDQEFRKYGGHGFAYMHGYSSTDFTGYHVYDGEKLVKLDHEADLLIEDQEEMPVLDGAEACYPLYCAIAKTIYKDIDVIEEEIHSLDIKTIDRKDEWIDYIYNNGKIVTFTNSVNGYYRLIYGDVDLFFGARPSANQMEEARNNNDEIVSIPIGKEAFVFFVEADNPIDTLSSQQLKQIYSGEIRNWKQVGGKNQKIIAFQRPEESGSQIMMKYFLGDTTLKDADTIETIDPMSGIIKKVKQYHNEQGAIGYTFRYFLEELNEEDGVKMLAIDGVYPSVETIRDGTYPILVDLVVSKMESNQKENVDKVIDFLLSEDGQEIIEKTGYGPLN